MQKPETLRNLNGLMKYGYDPADPVFKELVKTIGLATVCKFDYTPSSDEIRGLLAKKSGRSFKSIPHSQSECNPAMKELWAECIRDLQKVETEKPFIKRQVTGDASETGLIKFI